MEIVLPLLASDLDRYLRLQRPTFERHYVDLAATRNISRAGRHLAVSNAGGRTVSVYRRAEGTQPPAWSEEPVLELDACDPVEFEAANRFDRREGGSKGVAFGTDCLGVCSPLIGLRVYRVSAEPESEPLR